LGNLVSGFSFQTMYLGMLFSVAGTSLLVSHLTCWSFLVLGTLSTSCWLKPKVPRSSFVIFFVVSVLGGLVFLLSSTHSFCSGLLLQFAIMLKLGFAPFQYWIYQLLGSLDLSSSCFFLGPLKFGLLWLLVSSGSRSMVLLFLPLSLGLLLLWVSPFPRVLLYASGSAQVFILSLLGSSFFPFYYTIYCLALSGIAMVEFNLLCPIFAFLSLIGLPPLPIFVAKSLALLNLSFFSSITLLTISVFSLWPYLRTAFSFPLCNSSSPSHAFLLLSLSWGLGALFYY